MNPYSLLLITLFSFSNLLIAQTTSPELIGYWHNWNDPNAPSIPLNQIDSRYLILDFWYKGCVPCLKAIPFLNEISDRYNQNDLKVCGINPYDTDYSLLKQVIEKRNIKYSVFLDFSKGMMKKLLINVFPTVIVIDMKNKTIIYREEGFSEESKNKLTNFLNLELSRLR